MLYHNPQIIRNGGDLRIAGFRVEEEDQELSYLNVIQRTTNRMQKLVTQHVKDQMAEGTSRQDAIMNTGRLIKSYLSIDDFDYPLNEEEIVEQIVKSFEFQGWRSGIYYRFMEVHANKITEDTPLPTGGEYNPSVSEDMIKEVQENDSLWLVLEGLVAETIVK